MKELESDARKRPLHAARLVLVPALISLAVTLMRLTGELLHWSEAWFSPETGGIIPSGFSWLVGITWLPVPFGIYFAWQLLRSGEKPPRSAVHALLFALAGVAILFFIDYFRFPLDFPESLIPIWGTMLLSASVAYRGWPVLGRVLVAYGLASRVPVAVIMFLAMHGHWETHYDYVGMPPAFQMELWRGFFWLAFFPQLLFWAGFTVVLGSLAGSVTALLAGRNPLEAAPKASTSRLAG